MSLLRVSDDGDWIDCVAISHFSKARARTGNRGCLKAEKHFRLKKESFLIKWQAYLYMVLLSSSNCSESSSLTTGCANEGESEVEGWLLDILRSGTVAS